MNDDHFLETLFASLNQSASVKNVFGEPIRAGDKVIIPVAQLGLGMGGGFGRGRHTDKGLGLPDAAQPVEASRPESAGSGGGGGGGVYLIAKGVYEITPTSTRFIPTHTIKQTLSCLAAGFLLGLVVALKQPTKR